LVPYWAGWYGGLPTTSYSLTTPALLGAFGAVWLGALAIVATSLVAVPLLRDARRPSAGAQLVVIAATLNVISGRTTFAVGIVVALAALLAAERDHGLVAFLLAVLATATSPVAAFLLAVVAAGLFLVGGSRRTAFAIAVGSVAALGVLEWLSPDGGGYEPLTRTSLLMAVGTALVVVISPVGKRVRRVAVVSVVMLLAVFFVHSAIGANATRIAILGSAPAVVAASRSRVTMVFWAVVASILPLAQLHNDVTSGHGIATTKAFTAPLGVALGRAASLHGYRVEVVDPTAHWASTYLLPQVALARGWQRQTDEQRNPLFYGRAPLTATTYRSFLDRNAVGAVAVPRGVSLDYGARDEAALIAPGLPYLHPVWSNANWTLYAVDDPTPIVPSPLVFGGVTDTGVRFTAPAGGRYVVNLRYSPYLSADGASISEAADHETVVRLRRGGPVWLHGAWTVP
jgi:hypothetical protein